MESSFYITKASGETELFDIEKFKRSLSRSGADKSLIDSVVDKILKEKPFKTAKDIYLFTSKFLRKYNRGIACRYNLKNALRELGPTGHPFEQFVALIFLAKGYNVKTNYIANGICVSHEIDIVAEKDENMSLVECKFHNAYGIKTDVKIPLYVKARFDDVKEGWFKINGDKKKFKNAWIFTNTKFTIDAILYAECVNLNMVGWSYPKGDNLPILITQNNLFPITVLPSLTKQLKYFLLDNNILLCSQLLKNQKILNKINFSEDKIRALIDDAQALCSCLNSNPISKGAK